MTANKHWYPSLDEEIVLKTWLTSAQLYEHTKNFELFIQMSCMAGELYLNKAWLMSAQLYEYTKNP